MPFVRVFRVKDGDDKEILFNTENIWKIEVEYGMPDPDNPHQTYDVGAMAGSGDEDAIRFYRIFFGSDSVLLMAEPRTAVIEIIEGIYNKSVKG